MDERVNKYLEMLEHIDPIVRITGLDCLYTYDPRSALLENALKKMAVLDDSVGVRLKSIGVITEIYGMTSNKVICQFLAQIVDNKNELSSCRKKAYYAMKMICFTPTHQIKKMVESLPVEEKLKSVFVKIKEVTDMQKIYSPNFNIERDVDWRFVETFRV